MPRSDAVLILRFTDRSLVSPRARDFRTIVNRPDNIIENLHDLESRGMMASMPNGTWSLTHYGKYVCKIIVKTKATNIDHIKSSDDMV